MMAKFYFVFFVPYFQICKFLSSLSQLIDGFQSMLQQAKQLQNNSYKLKICHQMESDQLKIMFPLLTYLHSCSDQPTKQLSLSQISQQTLRICVQKDQAIKALESQITKYKAEQAKNNKLITQLQDKIAAMCPNVNNTGSTFMMGSEFKECFDDFMKNSLANIMGPLMPHPQAYAKYVKLLFSSAYQTMSSSLQNKLQQISTILNVEKNPSNLHTIKNSLLKLMQDNNKLLFFPNRTQSQNPYSYPFSQILQNFCNEQLIEISQSQQFLELEQKLIKICSYMILQQKPWHFVIPETSKIQKFNKKQFVCIDGWIKEKEDVIVILEGLAKGEDGRHPNLKNYVIPFSQQQQQFVFRIKEQISCVAQPLKKQGEVVQKQLMNKLQTRQKIESSCQYSPRSQNNDQIKPGKNSKKSRRALQQKQNQLPSNIPNFFSNVQPDSSSSFALNSHISLSKDLSCGNLKNRIKVVQKEQSRNEGIKSNSKIQTGICKVRSITAEENESNRDSKFIQQQIDSDQICILTPHYDNQKKEKNKQQNQVNDLAQPNLSVSIKKSSKLKNSSKVAHNLISDPSFEQIAALPYKKRDIIDQLPLKRQSSRTKKSNSRKTSVGKIVGQVIDCKENQLQKNNREQSIKENTKQSLYKEMIKQKLGTDHKQNMKMQNRNEHGKGEIRQQEQYQKAENHRTQREKTRDCKNKNKEEDRPLRVMHFKKIREKYLNL